MKFPLWSKIYYFVLSCFFSRRGFPRPPLFSFPAPDQLPFLLSPACWQILHPPGLPYGTALPGRASLVWQHVLTSLGRGPVGHLWGEPASLAWEVKPSPLWPPLKACALFWFGNTKKLNSSISTELRWTLPPCQSLVTERCRELGVKCVGSGIRPCVFRSWLNTY